MHGPKASDTHIAQSSSVLKDPSYLMIWHFKTDITVRVPLLLEGTPGDQLQLE